MPRYVDLDKLPQLEAWGCCCEGEDYAFVPVADVIQALRQAEAQTGEVEPVVHGYWILRGADRRGRGGIWMCSACGEYEKYKKIRCPYCGAKMDGEAPNEKPQG